MPVFSQGRDKLLGKMARRFLESYNVRDGTSFTAHGVISPTRPDSQPFAGTHMAEGRERHGLGEVESEYNTF